MDLICINVHPFNVLGMHGFYVSGMKILSVNVRCHGDRESVDATSESGLPVMNLRGP